MRKAFGAHFVEVEVDTELGGVKVLKYLAVHDSGRIINPLTAESQIKGAVIQGIGMALHEDLLYDRRTGQPLTSGYYGARIMTHLDAPEVEVMFIESDDGYGPFGAKCIGEAGIVHAVAVVGNANLQRNRTPHERPAHHARQDSGGAGMKTFANTNPRTLDQAVSLVQQANKDGTDRLACRRRQRSSGAGERIPRQAGRAR